MSENAVTKGTTAGRIGAHRSLRVKQERGKKWLERRK